MQSNLISKRSSGLCFKGTIRHYKIYYLNKYPCKRRGKWTLKASGLHVELIWMVLVLVFGRSWTFLDVLDDAVDVVAKLRWWSWTFLDVLDDVVDIGLRNFNTKLLLLLFWRYCKKRTDYLGLFFTICEMIKTILITEFTKHLK
jgi:hypothetical protein